MRNCRIAALVDLVQPDAALSIVGHHQAVERAVAGQPELRLQLRPLAAQKSSAADQPIV